MAETWFSLLTILNLGGVAGSVWLLLQCKTVERSVLLRSAIGLFAVGLLAQAFRNAQFLITGESPTDSTLPLWALKDIGGSMAVMWAVYMLLRMPDKLNKIILAMSGRLPKPEDPEKPKPRRTPAKPLAKAKPKPAAIKARAK